MNKKDYIKLAEIIKSSVGAYTPHSYQKPDPFYDTVETKRMIIHDMFMTKLCNYLKQDNEKFDEKKFRSFADTYKKESQ
tara:strand:- start:62 stop:298 length:237 start_codon:yes stop_codon:yes gene_type:complete